MTITVKSLDLDYELRNTNEHKWREHKWFWTETHASMATLLIRT